MNACERHENSSATMRHLVTELAWPNAFTMITDVSSSFLMNSIVVYRNLGSIPRESTP